MERRNLLELLREEQEPFVLKDFITERSTQLQAPTSHSRMQTTTGSPSFPTKTPSSATKMMITTLLREAAARIDGHYEHEQQKKRKKKKGRPRKPFSPTKGLGFGLFLSVLKKLVLKKPRREIGGEHVMVSVKDILNWDSPISMETREMPGMALDYYSKFCSIQHTTALRSPQIAMDTCAHTVLDQERFRSTPSRFLIASSSSSRLSDHSPASSPAGCRLERQLLGGARDEMESSMSGGNSAYSAEEKDQFSPVSILDPLFEEGEEEEEEEDMEQESYYDEEKHVHGDPGRVHCFEQSLAIVQRSRKQLLSKIRRFERLAGLDPLDLEKRMASEDDEDQDDEPVHDNCLSEDEEAVLLKNRIGTSSSENLYHFTKEDDPPATGWSLLNKNNHRAYKMSSDMMRLVVDIMHEERNAKANANTGVVCDVESMAITVQKRLEGWDEVESNTINMMVAMDLRRFGDEWKRKREQVLEVVVCVEIDIFLFLIEELSLDLMQNPREAKEPLEFN